MFHDDSVSNVVKIYTTAANKSAFTLTIDRTTDSGNNNLLSDRVFYKGDNSRCDGWDFDENGNLLRGSGEHDFVDGKCTICGAYNTAGVVYGYDEVSKSYYVAGCESSLTEVIVLDKFDDGEHGEKAVKYLNAEAFAGNATITKVILPASVTELKGGVFLNCYNLKYISMTGVETLNDWNANNNFLNCINLETVIVGKMFEVQAQQFKFHGETAVTNPNIYVDGAKSESSISIEYGGDINNLLSGDVYYKGDASKCVEWNFDVNGNVVHGANAHNFVDGKCSACGKIQTEGVLYVLDEEQDCYYVSGYTGTSKEVYVLSEYESKPVSYVKFEAFKDNTNITKVVLPASVTDLDGNAFWGCTQLKYLSMVGVKALNYGETQRPYGTRYGNNNFRDCVNLETVIVSNEFSSNVSQFGSGDSSAKAVVRFFVKGASGNPSLQDDQLLTGTVYFYSENNVLGAWHYVNGAPTLWA